MDPTLAQILTYLFDLEARHAEALRELAGLREQQAGSDSGKTVVPMKPTTA